MNAVCPSGEVFVVQWERVRLSGKESEGAFTFQVALYKTGTITFGYREVRFSAFVCFLLVTAQVSDSSFCPFIRCLYR